MHDDHHQSLIPVTGGETGYKQPVELAMAETNPMDAIVLSCLRFVNAHKRPCGLL